MTSTTKTLAILQSNYIPWKGYFDMINMVDEFVLYDDVQYTRRDWRNRNKIKTANGVRWITIPVKTKGKYNQLIYETTISDDNWWRKHWQLIEENYRHAPAFREYSDHIFNIYKEAAAETFLSKINSLFLRNLCHIIGIETPITWSMDYRSAGTKTDRLVSICRSAGADAYINGPAGRAYIEEDKFKKHNIKLEYMDYSDYPEYPQLYPPFDHHVSIIDLIFNVGDNARSFMKSFSQ